jgi:hypothetical protein
MDLIVGALRCDLTRVVTLQIGEETEHIRYPFIPGKAGDHHQLHHDAAEGNPGAIVRMGQIHNWHAKQVSYLIRQLDSVIEDPIEGRTLLDNCVVVWLHAFSNGGEPHSGYSVPCLIAGECGGFFKTGYHIDYRNIEQGIYWSDTDQFAPNSKDHSLYGDRRPPRGRLYNEFLISLMIAMGLQPSEWEIGGNAGFGTYDPNFPKSAPQYATGNKRDPLPFIVK